MRIIITGSAGKIGRHAMAAFSAAGHSVTGLDLRSGVADGLRTVACDCTDFGQVMGALSGMDMLRAPDAIVHLAGIPQPMIATDDMTFGTNTLSTYNVFSAAARLGINRIVWGSSESIHGLPFTTPPDFLPVDETHSVRPSWSYSLSKKLGEAMADDFVRWNPVLSIVSLRIGAVVTQDDYGMLPATEPMLTARRANLWSYVDARDVAQACVLAAQAELSGHERMIIAAADTAADVPSAELADREFPGVPVRGSLEGHGSLLSSRYAEGRIGYRPRYSWRHPDGQPT
jgi:nucleoside-diphosphate-sugar epimerase